MIQKFFKDIWATLRLWSIQAAVVIVGYQVYWEFAKPDLPDEWSRYGTAIMALCLMILRKIPQTPKEE